MDPKAALTISLAFSLLTGRSVAVLEGLVKLLAPKRARSVSEEQMGKILDCVKEVGLETLLARFNGFIVTLDEVNPKNCLRDWAAKRLLGVAEEDVKAWNKLRDPAAHGELLMDGTHRAKNQKRWTALRRVKNLVNRLLLNAMQYDGTYYDYAETMVKPFAHASLTDA